MSGGLMLLLIGLVIGTLLSIFLIIKIILELKKDNNELAPPQGNIDDSL